MSRGLGLKTTPLPPLFTLLSRVRITEVKNWSIKEKTSQQNQQLTELFHIFNNFFTKTQENMKDFYRIFNFSADKTSQIFFLFPRLF